MKKFMDEYKILVFVFLFSTIYVVAYPFIDAGVSDFGTFAIILDILFQLGIGLIVNTIFLYTQVYLMKTKQQKYIDVRIAESLKTICFEISNLFSNMNEMYKIKGSIEEYEESDFLLLLRKVDLKGIVPRVISPRTSQHYILKDYIVDTIGKIETRAEKLCRMFGPYLSMEVLSILDEIMNSTMHVNFARCLLCYQEDFSQCEQDPYFFSYYELMKRLEKEREKLIG